MTLKVILLAIALMAAVFILMAIKTILKKNGTFPNLHIGGNSEMKKRGIYCVQTMDKVERKEKRDIFEMEKEHK
jgi:hypothetical protein